MTVGCCAGFPPNMADLREYVAVLYRVGEFMSETTSDPQDRGGDGSSAPRKRLSALPLPDPNRLNTPAGERVLDIYRKAFVNGGLDVASAREAHRLWHTESMRDLPSLLMMVFPAGFLGVIDLSGLVDLPIMMWSAVLFATFANVLVGSLWQIRVAPVLHARGVPVWKRSLAGMVCVTLVVALAHELLHIALPHLFWPTLFLLPMLLPFQALLFWVLLVAYDLHIDYALVTSRWTDTPVQRLLPYDKRGKLVFLRASDHYVIVRTTKGEHELRMRFSDALERLGTARGLQVHRSFWVAQEFLSAPKKEGRRMVMRVENVVIPISATYREHVLRFLDRSSEA